MPYSAIFAALVVVMTATAASAQGVHVRGYTRSDGTYVAPHYRSRPDGNVYNNYSTQGNRNPYTGTYGTVSPYDSGYGGLSSRRRGTDLFGD